MPLLMSSAASLCWLFRVFSVENLNIHFHHYHEISMKSRQSFPIHNSMIFFMIREIPFFISFQYHTEKFTISRSCRHNISHLTTLFNVEQKKIKIISSRQWVDHFFYYKDFSWLMAHWFEVAQRHRKRWWRNVDWVDGNRLGIPRLFM